MKVVERLLVREEIDALELDLARARKDGDVWTVSLISARIDKLEAVLAGARHGGAQAFAQSRQRAA